MEAHEYAALFPMMSESEIRTLALDIKERGQQNPVFVLNGKILDGRNRFAACRSLKIAPRMETYSGDDPLGFVISNNLHRRHLTEPQRAMVAANLANLTNVKRASSREEGATVTHSQAAEMLNISSSSVTRAKNIIRNGAPELAESVKSGDLTVATAAHISTLPMDEQKTLIGKGLTAIKEKAGEIDREQRGRIAESPKESKRLPAYIPTDSREIWQQARMTLDRILPNDKHRLHPTH